jgi:YCII-related domain
MSKFLLTYRSPASYTAGSADAMAAWSAWFEDLADSLVDVGNPVFERSTVGNCPGETVLGGYSIIAADDLQAAVAVAGGCPLLQHGGGVEVGELTLLNPDSLATTVADHARATQLAD